MKKIFTFPQVIIIILILGIFSCLTYISTAQLNNREAALLSIILTILSIVASYLTSQYFSEKGHKEALEEVKAQHIENLKTYAINAAEKVDNLSKELHRLSIFLEDELGEEYADLHQGFHSRTNKIDSAVHIIETLKSVNDTSLSDWRGVIPEELEEKDEEQLKRETELKELIDRFKELSSIKSESKESVNSIVEGQVDNLRQQLIELSRRIDGVRIRPKKSSDKPLKETINVACPSCQHELSYKQRPMKNSFKPLMCQACGNEYTARWYSDKGFILEPNIDKEENIICPSCEKSIDVSLPTLVYSAKQLTCPHCNAIIKIIRNINDIKAKKLSGPRPTDEPVKEIPEKIIEMVQNEMPLQPWPKNIHKEVLAKLGISKHLYDRAIQELIRRKVFHPQVDGIIYYRKDEFDEQHIQK